jgi:chlorophyll synthase
MWAFGCGAVSAGVAVEGRWGLIAAGIVLAGPLVCATSQVVNDWYDRHVDAINEPNRPIPSGRIPGRWGLWLALAWTALSLAVAALLGPVVFPAAVLGLVLAWAYSAPPFRLKRNGWWGNLAVGLCYESLPWFTGAAVLAGTMPSAEIVVVAVLYGLGAHGIMTLNDFKAIEGDVRTGVGSLPVRLGVDRAARLACLVMAAAQIGVVAGLVLWDRPLHALIVTVLLAAQGGLMSRFLASPRERAVWFSGLGVTLYVLGMLAAAFGLAGLDA